MGSGWTMPRGGMMGWDHHMPACRRRHRRPYRSEWPNGPRVRRRTRPPGRPDPFTDPPPATTTRTVMSSTSPSRRSPARATSGAPGLVAHLRRRLRRPVIQARRVTCSGCTSRTRSRPAPGRISSAIRASRPTCTSTGCTSRRARTRRRGRGRRLPLGRRRRRQPRLRARPLAPAGGLDGALPPSHARRRRRADLGRDDRPHRHRRHAGSPLAAYETHVMALKESRSPVGPRPRTTRSWTT